MLRHSMNRSHAVIAFLCFACPALLAGPAEAGLQDDLNDRWRGAWVIVEGELHSNCDGGYTNNQANGRLLRGEGRVTLPAGELAQVHKVDLKKRRVDVLLDIHEPVLLGYQDGPFVLHQEETCQVELMIDIPGEKARKQEIEDLEADLDVLLDRFVTLAEARQSPDWNQRRRRSYPPDYEQTVAEYKAWKVETYNQAVEEKISDAVDRSSRLMVRLHDLSRSGPRYLEEFKNGFLTGILAMTGNLRGSCEQLLQSQPATYAKSVNPPNRAWADGFGTGQRLAYHVGVAGRLQDCSAPPPEPSYSPSWQSPVD